MATVNISYQSAGTSITMTSNNRGDGVWWSSALVDNGTNKYVDALFGGSIQVGTLGANGTLDIYVAASWDGTDFTAGLTAGSGPITWGTTGKSHVGGEKDLFFVASLSTDAGDDDQDIWFGPFSVAQACGAMPQEWCVVVENNTGATTHTTGSLNSLKYTGIEYDIV